MSTEPARRPATPLLPLLPLDEALARLLATVAPLPASRRETVSTFAARDRILAEDVASLLDVPPADNMLVVSNDDRPGVIGVVGTLLGNHNVNIADMDVGKALKPGTALMVIAPTAEVPAEVVEQLRVAPGILNVAVLHT